ncbi:hypothetical protein KUV57_11875 [Epibacterium sp. DP7N7-1]|nr:hypothetical protein [Epibacterium sp. DP7N7-1]
MKTYHLFQLNAEQHADPGLSVMKARFGQIDEAVRKGMYRHVASMNARNEEDVFHKTRSYNGDDWKGGHRIIEAKQDARDIDVGDVIVDMDSHDAWVCLPYGWDLLSWDRCSCLIHQADAQQLDRPQVEPEIYCF